MNTFERKIRYRSTCIGARWVQGLDTNRYPKGVQICHEGLARYFRVTPEKTYWVRISNHKPRHAQYRKFYDTRRPEFYSALSNRFSFGRKYSERVYGAFADFLRQIPTDKDNPAYLWLEEPA